MDFTYKKSTCERYDLRWDRYGWAIITIDERGGIFNAQSDYGSYAYAWPNHGRKSFKHFIMEMARDKSYFLGKVSSQTYFDYDKSLAQWKRTVIEHRMEGNITREQARWAWDYLVDLNDYGNRSLIEVKLYENYELSRIFPEPWYTFSCDMDYPYDARMFAERVLPMFAEILKKELAGDAVPVPA